jgi:hypothetical protein
MRARLEQIAASMQWTDRDRHLLLCRQWVKQAAATKFQLLRLLDSLHAHRVPDPFGTQDSIIEFDRRQSTKYELLSNTIETCIDTAHAVRYLCSAGADTADAGPLFSWEASAIDLHRALRDADGARARKHLTRLFAGLRDAPLLYVPLDKGGNPRKLFESRYVRDVIKQTAQQLPRLGMFRETYKLLETTQTLEQRQTGEHQQVTEFNLLFPVAYTAVIENIVPELDQWAGKDDDETAATWISPVVEHFSRLWLEHSSGVQYGELDRALDDKAWKRSVKFIKTYGRALFTQSFMTVGNLRGILRQGVGEFLDHLVMEMDPYHPMPLALDIADARVTKKEAVRQLSFILRAILENYEVYQDYNSTTTQSDYGENLHLLLDLLRVLHSYERHRWSLEPAYVAHSILARSGRLGVAAFLEQAFVEETEAMADSFVKKLQRTERKCGIYLASIEDRISERFVRPLRLNRLLALLKPCIEQAAKGNTQSDAFQAFQSLVEEFVQTAPGAGIHVPDWLEKVEDEVARLLGGAHEFIHPAVLPVQRKSLSFTEFQKQLEHWDKPLEDGGAR